MQRPLQLARSMAGRVEQRIDLEYAHALRARRDLHDLVAGLYLALLQHTQIEPGPAVGDQQRRHPRLIHADANSVTGHAGLCDFEDCPADPITIADTHLLVGQAVDREVLAELSIDEVVATQLCLPIAIGIDLIDEDGPLLAAVAGQIPLPVAVDIEPAHHAPALDRCLPNAGVNGLASPDDFARQADVDRKQACRHFIPAPPEALDFASRHPTSAGPALPAYRIGIERSLQLRGAAHDQRIQRTRRTSLPLKCRESLSRWASAASERRYSRTVGARIARASNNSAMRSRACRERRTAGLSDVTSSRSDFGACAPEAIKAARPPGLSTANDFRATSPPTVSKTASQRVPIVVKSWAL